MDVETIVFVGIPAAVGYATIVFRFLKPITEKTENAWDNRFVNAALKYLTLFTEKVSLNRETKAVIIKVR